MGISIDTCLAETFLDPSLLRKEVEKGQLFCRELYRDPSVDPSVKGWVHCDDAAVQLDAILEKASEIRRRADVFVLVGVGGSNQAARAVVEALPMPGSLKILYAGNTLSAAYLRDLLDELRDKSVYINVIAKNFETLEPGSHYRILRLYMEGKYDKTEMARRVILTGTRGSRLEAIAREQGHLFLDFPLTVGGRYSAFTPVGLLPIAVAGLDVEAYLLGAQDMERRLSEHSSENPAIKYAAVRNLLFKKGFLVEMLAAFEPQLSYFSRWWWQLFGESEGKDGLGIFPSYAIYSEDLHSIGQYMQAGQRVLMETFLSVVDPAASVVVGPDASFDDRFDYLNGMDFAEINKAAEAATIGAHHAGGVPCMKISIDRIDAYHFGQLFYFFMIACAVSGKLLGVNPFDQEGVEMYKKSMFAALGKRPSV